MRKAGLPEPNPCATGAPGVSPFFWISQESEATMSAANLSFCLRERSKRKTKTDSLKHFFQQGRQAPARFVNLVLTFTFLLLPFAFRMLLPGCLTSEFPLTPVPVFVLP